MTQYKALDGESIFDIALKLYKSSQGVNDILLLNPLLNLNASLVGVLITYDETKIYKDAVQLIVNPLPGRPDFFTYTGQTLYDLAIQNYGDVSKITEVIAQMSGDINTLPVPGTRVKTVSTSNVLANSLFLRTLAVSYLPASGSAPSGSRLLESGAYRLLESGGYRLHE